MVRLRTLLACTLLALACSACRQAPAPADAPAASWEQVLAGARGQQVTMAMWQGDPAINAYMREYVAPQLASQYGVTLQLVPGQGSEVVTSLLTEAEAHRPVSALDVVWINGETFYQLRRLNALHGPFTERLPNNQYIDWDDPTIAFDFQQPVQGYEAPWGNVQLLLISDRQRVPHPPQSAAALAAWIHAHPGRFTFDTGFTGMSLLKSLMAGLADDPRQLDGPFDPARYQLLRQRVFDWVRGVRGDLWHQGRSFPSSTAQLHQLFAVGELDFTMSFNDGEVDNKVASGQFPASAYGFPLLSGTLRNSHYLGIVARAPHKNAALVLINFLLSPEAQWRKLDPAIWGDGSVLAPARLPPPWAARLTEASQRRHAPARAALTPYALREPAPEYMLRLTDDFRREILHE